MSTLHVESAVNGAGQVLVLVPPQGSVPVSAAVDGSRIEFRLAGGGTLPLRAAREACDAASRAGAILVVEAVGARVSRETVVPVREASA